ncbi:MULTISPECIES: hypothetical protein [unclassified Streptomyces]|nr:MULTISPECIES: hypothetical protein [unclassified Streptomyces]
MSAYTAPGWELASKEVTHFDYFALDMPFAVLVGQISAAYGD